MSTLNFDANTVEPSTGFDPIPAGKYPAVIVESNMKPTKNGNGQYLELTFEIIDGDFKGRKVWARLNLENQNSTAVQIARSELSAICRAVGVMQPQDSIELHNLPLIITVRCKKNPETDEITNEIKGYAGRTVANAPAAGAFATVKRLILPSVLLALALALAAAFEGIYPYAASNLALEQVRDGIPAGMCYTAIRDCGAVSSQLAICLCVAWLFYRVWRIFKPHKKENV